MKSKRFPDQKEPEMCPGLKEMERNGPAETKCSHMCLTEYMVDWSAADWCSVVLLRNKPVHTLKSVAA